MSRVEVVGYALDDYQDAITRLRWLRENQRLSTRRVEELGGPGYSTISEAETGAHSMGASALFAYARALGYDLALIPREDAP